ALGLAAVWTRSAEVVWWRAALYPREQAARTDHAPTTPDTPQSPGRPSVEVAAWAGLGAAALWLLDPGASRQGGWTYSMFHGVWPQLMAATLWAASLGLTWRAFADPRPRRLALAALALGASLWAHPFALLTAAGSTAAWAVLLVLGRHRWPAPMRTFVVIHGAALLLAAGWLATFFGSADAMARLPVPWAPLAELGAELVQGRLMVGHWVWAVPLGLWGAASVVRGGGTLGWAVLGLAVGQLVLGSEEAVTVLRLDLVHSGFKNLQFPRYAISLKPLWFSLGGVGLGRLVAWLGARRTAPRPLDTTPLGWARRGVAALLLAPLVAALVPEAGRLVARPVAAIDTLGNSALTDAEAELQQALRQQAQALPPHTPLTVAVMRRGMGGATFPLLSVADVGGRLVLDEHVPAVNFKHRIHRRPSVYESLGVTHVLHDRALPDSEKPLASCLTEVGQYGPFTLERFTPPHGEPRRVAQLQGVGTVEVLADEPEHLLVEVTHVEPGARLILGRAPHMRWEITHDGEVLEPQEARLDQHGTTGLEVVLPGPGRVELRYWRSRLERRAPWISVMMLLLCAVGLLVGGAPLATRPAGPRAMRLARASAAVAGLLLVVAIARRQATALEQTWTDLDAPNTPDTPRAPRAPGERAPPFLRDLVVEGELEPESSPERMCIGLHGKDVLDDCSEAAHRPHDSFLYREPYLYRCLLVSVPPKGETIVHFPALAERDHVIMGSLVRQGSSRGGKALYWGSRFVDKPVRSGRHDYVLDRRSRTIDDRPTLTLRNDSPKVEQVCVSAAMMQRP
ncbi:MAG: hypothetical protein KDK70_25670, partial [Myxococcales bacterium]|nr:hypothetical protein [Myxococcales bacterium]